MKANETVEPIPTVRSLMAGALTIAHGMTRISGFRGPSIQCAIHRNRVLQRRAAGRQAAWAPHARDQRDVEKLLHVALESHPFDDVAVADVDDEQAAPRHGFSLGELIVERQALKTPGARQ